MSHAVPQVDLLPLAQLVVLEQALAAASAEWERKRAEKKRALETKKRVWRKILAEVKSRRENRSVGRIEPREKYDSIPETVSVSRCFLSPDPLGYDGGTNDLYSAFNGDPINFVDPTGRKGDQVTETAEDHGWLQRFLWGSPEEKDDFLTNYDKWKATTVAAGNVGGTYSEASVLVTNQQKQILKAVQDHQHANNPDGQFPLTYAEAQQILNGMSRSHALEVGIAAGMFVPDLVGGVPLAPDLTIASQSIWQSTKGFIKWIFKGGADDAAESAK